MGKEGWSGGEMNVEEIQEKLELETLAGKKGLDKEVSGGYCGDLLSDVMAGAEAGSLWFTVQSHQNIVAVAVLRELAGIVLVNGRAPDDDTKAKAEDEGIPILVSRSPAYHLAGRLYELGIGRIEE
jgi:predicted transcriptional regulator